MCSVMGIAGSPGPILRILQRYSWASRTLASSMARGFCGGCAAIGDREARGAALAWLLEKANEFGSGLNAAPDRPSESDRDRRSCNLLRKIPDSFIPSDPRKIIIL